MPRVCVYEYVPIFVKYIFDIDKCCVPFFGLRYDLYIGWVHSFMESPHQIGYFFVNKIEHLNSAKLVRCQSQIPVSLHVFYMWEYIS